MVTSFLIRPFRDVFCSFRFYRCACPAVMPNASSHQEFSPGQVSLLLSQGKNIKSDSQGDVGRCVQCSFSSPSQRCYIYDGVEEPTIATGQSLYFGKLWSCSLTGHMDLLLLCLITAAQMSTSFLTFSPGRKNCLWLSIRTNPFSAW